MTRYLWHWRITYHTGSWSKNIPLREGVWFVRAPTAADALTMFEVFAKSQRLEGGAFQGAESITVEPPPTFSVGGVET